MAKKKKSNFIPSPFKVVTEYEKEFVKIWNNNTANAMSEVLKYIASATSAAKADDGKGVMDDIL